MPRIDAIIPKIEGAEVLRKFYGKYPSMHDCEVLTLHFDRELTADFSGPKLLVEFYVFDSDVAPESALRRPAKLKVLFAKIELEDMKGFNHQNPFSDILVEEYSCDRLLETRYRFSFGEMGFWIRFTASSFKILSIEPFSPIDWFANNKT